MLKPDSHLIDDLAKMAGGVVNIMSGLQQQIHDDIKARVDEMAARLDLVPREDLERLEARIAALEDQLADKKPTKKQGKKTTKTAKKAGKPKAKKADSKKTVAKKPSAKKTAKSKK